MLYAIAILSLGLATGFSSFLFAIDHAGRTAPVGFADPDHLYEVDLLNFPSNSGQSRQLFWQSASADSDLVRLGLEAWDPAKVASLGDEQRELAIASVTSNYFDVLGVRPVAGRVFRGGDDPPSQRGVVISQRLWREFFADDRTLAHSWIVIEGTRRRVIGSVPRLVPSVVEPDVWELSPSDSVALQGQSVLYARPMPGKTIPMIEAALSSIASRTGTGVPPTRESRQGHASAVVVPVRRDRLSIPNLELVLAGAAICIMLIACTNVVAILMAKAIDRRPEWAVRVALGASRGRLLRGVFVECASLLAGSAVFGGIVAVILAQRLNGVVAPALRIDDLPYLMDWRAFVVAVFVAAVVMCLCAAFPALRVASVNPLEALKQNATTTVSGRRRVFAVLVGGEIALCFVLLTVTGSFANLLAGSRADSGVDTRALFETTLNLSRGISVAHLSDSAADAAVRRVTENNSALVSALAQAPNIAGTAAAREASIAGQTVSTPSGAHAYLDRYLRITPGYFRVVAARVVAGVVQGDPSAAVVDDKLATRLWSSTHAAIGQTLEVGEGASSLVVHITAVIHELCFETTEVACGKYGRLYVNTADVGPQAIVLIRVVHPGPTTSREIAEAMRRTAPTTAFSRPRSVADLTASVIARQRLILTVMSLITLIALVLAASGIHGIASYAAFQRRREHALRLLLGARVRDSVQIVVSPAIRVALVASGVGCLLAGATTKVIASVLPGYNGLGPIYAVFATIFVVATIGLGSWFSIQRVRAISPANVLREW